MEHALLVAQKIAESINEIKKRRELVESIVDPQEDRVFAVRNLKRSTSFKLIENETSHECVRDKDEVYEPCDEQRSHLCGFSFLDLMYSFL